MRLVLRSMRHATQLLPVQRLEGGKADILDQEAKAGTMAVLAIPVLVEYALDRFGNPVDIGHGYPVFEQRSHAAVGTHAAANVNREALFPVANPTDEPEIVDGCP